MAIFTTRRRFALIMWSRAALSPRRIRFAREISSSIVRRAVLPISWRYIWRLLRSVGTEEGASAGSGFSRNDGGLSNCAARSGAGAIRFVSSASTSVVGPSALYLIRIAVVFYWRIETL